MHSPKHYDKFTYSTRRRPEGPNNSTVGTHNSPNVGRVKTEYEACVAGIAPLAPNPEEGFCIAEDGRISSRWVTPSRFGAPAVALVQVPVTVTTRPREGAQNGTQFESTIRTGIAVSPVRHNLNATSPGSGTRVARSPGRAGPAPLLAYPTEVGGTVNVKPMTKGGMNVKLITSPSKEVSQGAAAAITSGNNASSTVSYGGGRSSQKGGGQSSSSRGGGAAPFQRQASSNSTITIQSIGGTSPSVITTSSAAGGIGGEDWMAWKKLVALAVNEFNEEELVNLSWDAIADLCRHYNLNNPIDTARIQLAWKRKNGELLSDRADIFAPEPQPARETTVYLPTGTMQSPSNNNNATGYVRQTSFSSVLSASGLNAQPSSPRRGVNAPAYVPSYKSPMRWRNESKVDTGLVKPKHMRATTPTRNQEPPALVGSTFTRAATPRAKTLTRNTPKKVVSSRGM